LWSGLERLGVFDRGLSRRARPALSEKRVRTTAIRHENNQGDNPAGVRPKILNTKKNFYPERFAPASGHKKRLFVLGGFFPDTAGL